jgi:hypothetical protein
MVLHILHAPSPTGATNITHKNQNTLHTSKSAMVPEDRLQSDVLTWSNPKKKKKKKKKKQNECVPVTLSI